MDPINDKVNGKINSTVGTVKEMAGKAINDKDLEGRGNVQKNVGKAQGLVGALKEKIQEGSYALGDNIEKVGRKLQERGHERAGSAIERAGDKIEHLADPKH